MAWQNCLGIIRDIVPEQSFKTWFMPIRPVRLHNNVLTIQVPTRFFYEWLEEHYVQILRKAIDVVLGVNAKLEYSLVVEQSQLPTNSISPQMIQRGGYIQQPFLQPANTTHQQFATQLHQPYPSKPQQQPQQPLQQQNLFGQAASQQPQMRQQAQAQQPISTKQQVMQQQVFHEPQSKNIHTSPIQHTANPQHQVLQGQSSVNFPKNKIYEQSVPIVQMGLNEKYTFDTFIEGDCNRLARSAGYAVAQNPGTTSFNPLVVYGGVGLGKTHLVHAIGNAIRSKAPQKKVLYISADNFITQFIDALKENNIQKFTNKYLALDALIIDDIQFLSGKEKTQESFFHIFNHLHQARKQIIMTSDCPPRDIKGFHERLLSRFKWGLTTDLLTPDYETRMAIIVAKVESAGVIIPTEVVEFLAQNIDTNIRELEGVLVSLIAKASITQNRITIQLAQQTINSVILKERQPDVSIDTIETVVCKAFGIHPDDLKAKTRKKQVAMARQVAMYFANKLTELPLKTIGWHFGKRDHSTVIHACKTVENHSKSDEYKDIIEQIRLQLASKS